ncbi:hypothetical protein F5J12DRAFT_893880 [Pisolithus orientalis]|uniref:uncharacterized protein n=1 Tax=Pisolithus orientalis TaxID=936130 RepID=UPI0022240C0E|nr:uncharacterized protein F5J12DRAFT_893880 [Pisolithus orientalis]KAI6003254.1 hypothetical protein F5J12DRAFT_893880 [Pisolithus orientalis]
MTDTDEADIELQSAKDNIEFIELILPGCRRSIQRQDKNHFREEFSQSLTVEGKAFSLSVHKKKWYSIVIPVIKAVPIDIDEVLSNSPELKFHTVRNGLDITIGLSPSSTPVKDSLRSVLGDFRVLVIGQSGVGKSTLISQAFGIEQAIAEDEKPGEADIEKEFISPQNDRFVLHDSKGFEPAERNNYSSVKTFVENRKRQPHIKDQLHAVWLCFRTPLAPHGERLVERSAERTLATRYGCYQRHSDHTEGEHREGLEKLIELTYEKVTATFGSQMGTPLPVSVVTQMAQRVSPRLKIEGSIAIGKQRYWRALTSGANFWDHTILECLAVVHTDIVSVWNFNDPSQYLYSTEFRELMVNLVGTVDASTPTPHLPRVDTTSKICEPGPPLLATLPVILPFKAGLSLVQWVYETYQRLPDVHRKFMTYIVDLVHILEILFALTANKNEIKLTRGAISLAFNAYYPSAIQRDAHQNIKTRDYKIPGRDAVLEEIVSLLGTSAIDDSGISRVLVNILPADLERDDEWRTVTDNSKKTR